MIANREAEVALAPAELVAEVHEAVDLARAAAAGGALTTAALLLEHVARVRAGEVVLVHSAGGGLQSAPGAHDELAAGHSSGKRVVRVA